MKKESIVKKEKRQVRKRNIGFTLVELIVVLVILSIVSAIAVPSVLGYIDDSKAKECQSRLNALAADIATVKLSYEVDGENDADKFGHDEILEYIKNAGEDGKCPLGDTYEAVGDTQIKCPKGHAICNIEDAGSFSTAKLEVEENTEKRESPDSTATPPEEVTPTPDNTGEDTNPTPKPKPAHTYRVEIEPGPLDMETGKTENLQVKVYDENDNEVPEGQIKGVTWTFPDNGVVQGTADGLSASVKAQAAGSGEIQCTVTVVEENGATSTPAGSIGVTVKDSKPQLDVSSVPPVEAGKDTEIDASVKDAEGNPYTGTDVTVTYESKDDDIAEVDPNTGKVHGVAPGECDVTVTLKDKEGNVLEEKTVTVTVTEPKPQPSVELSVPGSVDLETGIGGEIRASVTPKNLDDKDVNYTYEWEAQNSSVEVQKTSEDGSTVTVTGETAGEYDITCKVTGTYTDEKGNQQTVTDEKTIHVKVTDPQPEPSVNVEVTPGSIDDLGEGESRELTAKVTPQGFEGKDNVEYKYEWKSSNPSVTVTPMGDGSTATVTGGSAGDSSTVTCTVTVTYTENGETKTVEDSQDISVTVTDSAADQKDGPRLDLEVTPSSATIKVGQITGFLAKPTAFGCTVMGFQWSARSTENAEITGESNKYTVRVTGKKVGECIVECTVMAQTNDEQHKTLTKTASATVNVEESGMFKDLPTPFLVDHTQGQRNIVNYLKDEYRDQSKGKWVFSNPNIKFNNNQDIDITGLNRADLPLEFEMTYVWNGGEKSETILGKAIIAATGMQQLHVQTADGGSFPNGTISKGDVGRVKCDGLQEPYSTDRAYLTFANWTPEIIEIGDIKWESGGTVPYVEFTALGVGKAKIVVTVYREYDADFLTQEIEFEVKPLVPTRAHFAPDPVNLSADGEQVVELVIDEPAGATVDGITSIQWEYDGSFVEIRESGEKYKYIIKGKQMGSRQIKARLNRDGMQQLEVMVNVNVQ